MSYQEKRNLVYLLGSFLIFSGYTGYVLQVRQDGRLESTNWGTVILLFIPIHIVINIIMHIVFSIINTLATQEEEPTIVDELDKTIELRATRNSYYVFSLGFLLAMITVAREMPLYVMFNLFMFAFFMAEVVWSCSHLYFYRRGV